MPLSTGEWIWRRGKTSPGTPQGESKAGAEPSLPLGTAPGEQIAHFGQQI